MRLWIILLLLVTAGFSFTTLRDSLYPTDYFRAPVGTAVRLSGTFGELRPNHFHAGIDIKGSVGDPLYAAAEGYVYRIKVEPGGYGKSLAINHPNGYTTIYAHMDKFTPEIEAFVKNYQYEQQQFEVEIFPEADKFYFQKGEKIGAIGLTGASMGPHLHFEVRHTRTETPVNPLLFGFGVADTRPPRMHQVKIYHLDKNQREISSQTFNLAGAGKNYGIKGDTVFLASGRAGFALKAYDHMDGVHNWNGIYSLEMRQDDSLLYRFEMERVSFEETRYLNAHVDYEEKVSRQSYFNRCFLLPGNELSIYTQAVNRGIVELKDGKKAARMAFIARDLAGNESKLEFWVKHKPGPLPAKKEAYNYFLPYNEESIIQDYSLLLHFPKGTFYEDLLLQYESSQDESSDIYSSVHHLHNSKTPVHQYFDISIRPVTLSEALKDKAFIAHCDEHNRVTSFGGVWENDLLRASVRELGDYCIMVDTVPPTITPVAFKPNMRGMEHMSFRIRDNFRTARNVQG
jgi:hypothetical protein